ncbi:hypothetical protein RR48_01102 [Papilio machaon]|uniref:Uncharacterized protein n=1 Tax=Papilio machaon TaxID=76193 RepID=A0A0N1PI38_PAPMA|nr:hypothetical protein RR48_01102 [Papilio machaon]
MKEERERGWEDSGRVRRKKIVEMKEGGRESEEESDGEKYGGERACVGRREDGREGGGRWEDRWLV